MPNTTVTLKDITNVAQAAYNGSVLNLGSSWQTIPTSSLSPGLQAQMADYGYSGIAAVNVGDFKNQVQH